MRLLFRLTIQQLDGVQDTQPNADGLLPVLMREDGFRDVRELETFRTPTGAIVLIEAGKPRTSPHGAKKIQGITPVLAYHYEQLHSGTDRQEAIGAHIARESRRENVSQNE